MTPSARACKLSDTYAVQDVLRWRGSATDVVLADSSRDRCGSADFAVEEVIMAGRFGRLAFLLAGVAIAALGAVAADLGEQGRLQEQCSDSSARFAEVCAAAWKYDNLRPTILRAVAPLGSMFRPPDVPVVHLSPGSPEYPATAGEMGTENRQGRIALERPPRRRA